MMPLATSFAHSLGNGLSQVASVLAVPVLLAAILVLLLCAVELGRYIAELGRRARRSSSLRTLTARVLERPGDAAELITAAPSMYAEITLGEIAEAVRDGALERIEWTLDDYEQRVESRLDRTRMLVRAGPAVGLMGTLIPLAPGLRALGRGDVKLLSSDLRIAFAATVMGLLAGTVAFSLTLARTRRWGGDLIALERATADLRATAAAARTARAERAGRELIGEQS